MRYIRWNQEIVDKTLEDFKDFKGHQKTLWGFVAENLVKDYYNQPLSTYTGTPDDGCDMVLNGMKVDIKSRTGEDKYFTNPFTIYIIDGRKMSSADYYLFTRIDPDTHSIALIGYLKPEEVVMKGTHYLKGEYIPALKEKAEGCRYLVSQCDLHRIN